MEIDLEKISKGKASFVMKLHWLSVEESKIDKNEAFSHPALCVKWVKMLSYLSDMATDLDVYVINPSFIFISPGREGVTTHEQGKMGITCRFDPIQKLANTLSQELEKTKDGQDNQKETGKGEGESL